ncbi:MAG: alkaline phosphatase family protein [Pirellulales bacterium]|nr:alkaline phosphatase family protein [Pirellulales bacterium]
MKQTIAFLAVAIGLLPYSSACRAAESDNGPVKKALLIGIDGCRFDAVRAADAPNIDRLIDEGALAQPIRIFPARYRGADTISGPGWSNILCGVWADKHGVLDNKFAAPNYEEYPHFFRRLKQARPAAFTASFSDWDAIAQKILRDADVELDASGKDQAYEVGDQQIADAASKLLGEGDPTATMVYFGQVDETGHQDGFHPSVASYVAAIERVDAHIGQLLDAIQSRASRNEEDWLILVTTDHGGSGTGHGGGHDNPEVACSWLVVSGDSAQRGRISGEHGQVDAVPTIFAHLGVEADPAWKLDGTAVGLKQ